MAQKRQHPSSPAASFNTTTTCSNSGDKYITDGAQQGTQPTKIFESLPIHDRGSVFIAIFSSSPIHINNPKVLQGHEPFKDAMHRMLAYRRESKQKALSFQKAPSTTATTTASSTTGAGPPSNRIGKMYATASDEDGEKYAGKKLEKLLVDLNVEGVIVVARWYGGILLGPVRFDHILNTAREAISKYTDSLHDHRDGGGGERAAKRTKLEENGPSLPPRSTETDIVNEAKEKDRLVRILKERDSSVEVLRGLLTEKSEELKNLTQILAHDQQDHLRGTRRDDDGEAKKEEKTQPVVIPLSEKDSPTSTQVTVQEDTKAEIVQPLIQSQATAPSTATAPASSGSTITSVTTSPSTKLEYATMPTQRLKQLEKARDASLGWILRQIDATEVKIKEAERGIAKKG